MNISHKIKNVDMSYEGQWLILIAFYLSIAFFPLLSPNAVFSVLYSHPDRRSATKLKQMAAEDAKLLK